MRVINLFAGPGSGKSTTAAGLFYHLKLADFRCELITEVAKDMTYEKNHSRLSNQTYILGEQYQRLHRVRNFVDYAISDSPIVLGLNYKPVECPDSFDEFCLDLFNQFDNLNYFITRTKKYQQYGRNESEEQARQIDENIKDILIKHNLPFKEIVGDRTAVKTILEDLCDSGIKELCNI